MTNKKLTLVGNDREILKRALRNTADTMDPDMRRIYDVTIRQIPMQKTPADTMLLTEAQQEIVKFALKQYEKKVCEQNPGPQPEITRMLFHLTLTRQEYAKWASRLQPATGN